MAGCTLQGVLGWLLAHWRAEPDPRLAGYTAQVAQGWRQPADVSSLCGSLHGSGGLGLIPTLVMNEPPELRK